MSELSVENSTIFASQFEMIKMAIRAMDWEYAELLVKKMREQVSRQQTLAAFYPAYPQKKNELIARQADALEKFVEGVSLLKECDRLKSEAAGEEKLRGQMTDLFL